MPPDLSDRLRRYAGRQMILGARPETLEFAAAQNGETTPGKAAQTRLPMRVQVVEPLGESSDVYLQPAEGGQVVARVSSQVGVTEGSTVQVALDVSRAHVFEPGETGLNVALNGYGAQSSAN